MVPMLLIIPGVILLAHTARARDDRRSHPHCMFLSRQSSVLTGLWPAIDLIGPVVGVAVPLRAARC